MVKFTNSDMVAVIDDCDIERVNEHRWFLRKNGYAQMIGDISGDGLLHRFIMKAKKGTEIDHIDRDKLNCRRGNMRFVTRSENCTNREAWASSGEKYIYDRKYVRKYMVQIPVNGKRKHIGYFTELSDAISARDEAMQIAMV